MSVVNKQAYIKVDWPAPSHVKAYATTRLGGVSESQFSSNNLALHVNDDEKKVALNRKSLIKKLGLPGAPHWLNQTHSTNVVNATSDNIDADASYVKTQNVVCAVMTADCLPILLCDKKGSQIAAIHAGWRGLLNGIIENAVKMFSVNGAEILVWLGPAIGPNAFEVGQDVRDLFVGQDPNNSDAFKESGPEKWLADIYALARIRLKNLDVNSIYGGDMCTYTEASRFYSYRRDRETGRMASLIWLDK